MAERTADLTRQSDKLKEQAALIDLAHDAIFVRDGNGAIVFWNAGATELYGWSGPEAIGRISHALLQTVFPRPRSEIESEVLRTGGWDGELIHTRRDGSALVVHSRWALHRGKNGQPPAFLEINRNITERKRAAEALARQAKELERSNEDLAQFAYAASHDLQEPLRTINSYVQILAGDYKGKLGPEADEFIHFVVDGTARMQALIRDLLTYSKAGKEGKPMKPVDIADATARALGNLRSAIEESGAEVTCEGLPVVNAEPSQMAQLMQNLIGNAIKYRGREAPRVDVSARRNGGEWIFSVRDNGIGIDPKYAESIFAVFRRLHARDEYEGTGIGLALCKKIVERHGGRIWVESEAGAGATFLFTLPV